MSEQVLNESQIAALKKLREPFPPEHINKLPKPYKKDSEKGKCSVCGGYHGLPAVHLDYVGHAALTHRLLEVDPSWYWEPLAIGQDGLPVLDKNGGLWIRLTVAGMSRLGYGAPDEGKSGPNAVKESIGDALRNAAMRFGAALDLWHKGDLFEASEQQGNFVPVADDTNRAKEKPPYKTSDIEANKALWAASFAEGKTNADALIAKIKTRYTLTAEQEQKIKDIEEGC